MRHTRKIMGGAAVSALAAGALLAGQAGGASAAALGVSWNFPQGFVAGAGSQNAAAPGAIAVNWRTPSVLPAKCTSAIHPVPVLLIHGTWENQNDNWQAMAPWLKNNGYCVYSLTYGNSDTGNPLGGTIHIWESAKQLGTAVDMVLKATGVPQVDFVGHSQGAGIMPFWYLDFLMRSPLGGNNFVGLSPSNPVAFTSGASKVRDFVMLSPGVHGTTLSGIATLGQALSALNVLGIISVEVPAASDQTTDSVAVKKLATVGDTVPGVHYTTVIEEGDQVNTPYTSQPLVTSAAHPLAAGASIDNIVLQKQFTVNWYDDVTKTTTVETEAPCTQDGGEHLANPYNSRSGRIVTDTLGGDSGGGYLDPYCHGIIPLVGG